MRPSPPTLTGENTSSHSRFSQHYFAVCTVVRFYAFYSTIVDLRLNENKIRSVHYSSLSRFGNLTYLNLTKNDISYVEDGAFSAQFNLQVSANIIYIYTLLWKCIFMDPLINAQWREKRILMCIIYGIIT